MRGHFGNRIRSWSTQKELLASTYRGLVVARSKLPGGKCDYGVVFDIAANEVCPDQHLILQGEITRSTYHGYSLFCSTALLPMRQALAVYGKQYYALQALELIRQAASLRSMTMLEDLLDLYDDAVIEFSCYDHCLGNIPGHNILIWEVRNY